MSAGRMDKELFDFLVELVRERSHVVDELVELWGEDETEDLRELQTRTAELLFLVDYGRPNGLN